MTDPKRRSVIAFALLFFWAAVFVAGWKIMHAQPLDGDTPRPFRQALEINGKIWQKLFKVSRQARGHAPPAGKIPRVNGDIGIKADLDPQAWKMEVEDGAKTFTVTMKDLLALPRTDTATEFRCIEGWSEDMSFAGVKFSDFMKAYNLESKKYVGLVSVDEEYYVSIDIESMMHDQTLLAYEMNGLPLRPANGSPLRLVIPVKYGIKHIKQIGRIYFSDSRPPDYWAEEGYDWYAGL
jgi:DMSO/TMAO reductase YedYZ molybdopterin-dependent catalytic subunit